MTGNQVQQPEAAIRQPSIPDGWRRTKEGVLFPEGTSDLTQGTSDLTQANQHLLALREKIDINSLQAALQNIYIEAAEYTDEKGVKRYKKLEGEEAKGLASKVMEELEYHANVRHFGMPEDLVKKLKGYPGPNDENLITNQTKRMFPVSEKDLESSLLEGGVTSQTIAGLGNDLGKRYEQRVLIDGLDEAYGKDPEQHRTGLLNLNSAFRISPKINREKLAPLELDALRENYIHFLYESMKKME